MSIDTNDEILKDFIIESSEILESLNEQLVELETSPDDKDLLNSVFRGFHTIKGGAGFLNISSLVEVCHRAEDVFNLLRQGHRHIDADLMDIMLKVIDTVTQMLGDIRAGNNPQSADQALIERLNKHALVDGELYNSPEDFARLGNDGAMTNDHDIGSIIDSRQPQDVDITDEEFELLLDQLHGVGKHGGAPIATINVQQHPNESLTHKGDGNGEMTQEEYTALLDYINPQPLLSISDAAHNPDANIPQPKNPESAAIAENRKAIDETAKKVIKDAHQPQVETSVRVDTKRLDDIMNMVGELVLVRNRLSTLKSNIHDEDVSQAVSNLDVVTTNLQNAVMKTRMQPIKKVFSRFPRVVRDLARTLSKEVSIALVGEDTDLDKNIVEALADPLVHLVRNSVDHGIEMPSVRVANGKPREGKIILTAKQEGDQIQISIEDDGGGIDPEVIKNKAIEKGIVAVDAVTRMDTREIFNLILLPGFSTKAEISDISGRGVGMDVVKTRISQLSGTVDISSTPGIGTRIDIKLPLTLAIMPTLMVTLSDQIFAFPLACVSEIFSFSNIVKRSVEGRNVVILRNKPIPLINLQYWLNGQNKNMQRRDGYVVIMKIGSQTLACMVDNLIGQEEVVIKPLGSMLHGTKGVAGATITGNGKIALILDMPELMKKHAKSVHLAQ